MSEDLTRRRELFSRAEEKLRREGLNMADSSQWFHIGELFKSMGTKTLGTFCSVLSYRSYVKQHLYLLGFMDMNSHIPGLGEIDGSWVKLSSRTPSELRRLVEMGERKPLSEICEAAASEVGGYADGHAFAASGMIPKGREEKFVEAFEALARVKRGQTTLI